MASIWNSEYEVVLEGKDLQANAMAVDITGTYVLLAGRRYIALRNLDEDLQIVQKFPRQSKYDVGAAEWNPTKHHRELCVISSNQRLEVLTWRMEELTQTHSLKAHTRVITDLNWHQMDPNLLASCSVDTFIYIWDLRDSRRPSLALSAIAEASQVRWNRLSSFLLATAHDGDIKIWDQRKGTAPVQYVAAHLAKIHGLDWSRTSETQFATSSQDNTVKFFDTTNPRKAEYILTTNAPVWRARYTPFGNGLITAVVPQLRRGENSLLLWNTENRATPMHTFMGHKDVVLEFEWRHKRPGDSCFQLITWSKDQTLLIWKIEPFLQKLCGYEPDESQDIPPYPKENVEKIIKKPTIKVEPLQQEFSLLNVHIPNLEVKSMNLPDRLCTVTASVNRFTVNLQVSFPPMYPHGVPPNFEVEEDSQVDENIASQLLQTLNHLAQQRVSKNRTCLESCLRQMVTTLEQLVTDSEADRMNENTLINPANTFGGYNDAYIPFPRTSGAKFCSVDTLVCFGRMGHSRRLSTKIDSATPRALSALENLLAKRSSQYSVSAYYYQKPRNRISKYPTKLSKAIVHIYDSSGLFLVHKQLAEEYVLDGDVGTICKHNAAAAALTGRWDLVQAWALAELAANPQQVDEDDIWSKHPFNVQLMQSLISHYASLNDLQMAAMLCCIFSKEQELLSAMDKKNSKYSKSSISPYHTIPPADVMAEGWVFPSLETIRSSSSLDCLWSDDITRNSKNQIPGKFEYYKLAYAEILYRWGLLYNRAEVLKYLSIPPEVHKGVEFLSDCKHCSKPSRSANCNTCRKFTLNCIICHISVRGSSNCCIVCGHGGHTTHLLQWFEKNDVCPSGCGCKCLSETANMFNN